MKDHPTTTTDGGHDGRMPAWEKAAAHVRKLQRLQLALLLLAGSAIIVVVVVGGLASVASSQEQRELEERGQSFLELRGDFAAALFDVQASSASGGEALDASTLLRFISQASRAYALANSYEPASVEERRARDRLISLYESFLAMRSSDETLRDFRALHGTQAGRNLARTAAEALDEWIEANAANVQQARVRQNQLLSRIAAGVILLVIAMATAFVFIWRRIERSREMAVTAAYAQTRRFNSLVRNSSDMVMVMDGEGCFTYCSRSVQRLLGWDIDDLHGKPVGHLVHPDDAGRLELFADKESARALAEEPLAWRLRRSDGSWLDAETLATDLRNDPAVGGVVLNSRDVTDRKAVEEELVHQALHDPLTGLANRLLFDDRLNHALETRADGSAPLAVLILDLDDFKTVNDSLGHQIGDELLNIIGQRLANAVRPGDTAARLGGDEYAVLLENVAGRSSARKVAERIADALSEPIELDDKDMIIGASMGIALAPHDADDAENLVRFADMAMYAAKRDPNTSIISFAPEMERSLEERLKLTLDLNAAIDDADQLQLEYQPIVNLDDGNLVGVEALLRWNHPELGRMMPDRFIPLAEETGAIVQLGYHVLREACAAGAEWNSQLSDHDALMISVNLSARQLEDPALLQVIRSTLEESGLTPSCLILEVTESVLMRDVARAVRLLEDIKAAGIRIAIDDFGTGYSSLSQLGRLPVDMVKIDKSFVDDLSGGNADSELAGVIVQLGAVLKLDTVAEGVEAGEQVTDLRDLQCHLGQGFYFARPMPAPDVARLVEAERRSGTLGTPTG